ncbi:glycosyltransferase family 117 protein [Emticicia sp. SJ17W-69]|uniref:glycosyltransferase family 117 protein n=1 Tax=Emticicia sp. SJ17W-69 TaxID=3421657 RepID=UPI003EBA7151
MNNFKRLNNIVGWAIFAVALLTYTLTVEPTASFWDCGEFIACSYKLQVPHPAGAPLFLLIGRMASLLAGSDVTKVALMVNMVSVIASAFTILFMFWTISLLARKVFGKKGENLDTTETILVLGASAVGSLVYTFSDSFWFSAVEAEVYGMSSFFTAIVIWAAFRWENIEDEAAANRFLIFTAYLVGLSIGVHLLNLVTIPALGLVYYYKKAKKITWKGGIAAFLVGMVVLGVVNVGVITGFPSLGFTFEKLFVNSFGMPFSSGIIFFVILLIGGLAYGIFYTQKKEMEIANTALLSFAFVLIGYSSYTIALIRSNYNPPINENNPSNVLNYVSYLKREQYGSRPLLYGPVFTGKLESIENGEPIYKMGKGKYEIYDYKPTYIWGPNSESLLPRMWSTDAGHQQIYRQEMGLAQDQKPTLFTNIGYMFKRQMGYMYWRYFAWNFWGRSSDIEGAGPTNILETKASLPPAIKENRGRTNFFGLPVILGILGLLYHYFRRERDALVMFLLFLFTGIGLVVFLNSPPVEPRERDYIYVGSFYIWAIWVGLGVMGLFDYALKFIKNSQSRAIGATALGLAVPLIMAPQTWKGHDRSGRYHQVDFAKNLLNSCAKNAILFTGGDNDTFPLWYVQEVEGFRTDVRVCNLSLLGTDWYCEQMKRKTYESEALPITFSTDQLLSGVNDQIPYVERLKDPINLKDYLELVKKNDPAIQIPLTTGESINSLPSDSLFLTYNVEDVKKLGFVPKQFEPFLSGQITWNIGKRDLLKNDLMQLEMIAQNNWKRPIYFAGTLANDNYLNLKDYMQLEGYAYRLLPIKVSQGDDGFANTDIMYENMLKKMSWRGMDNPNVYYDSETYLKVPIITARLAFLRLADQLVREEKKAKAKEVLDYANKVLPDKAVPFDQLCSNYVMYYFEVGDSKKAMEIAETITKRADGNLAYFTEKSKYTSAEWMPNNVQDYLQINLRNLQVIANICSRNGQEAAAKRYEATYNKYYDRVSQ